jgi:hypothetical protein
MARSLIFVFLTLITFAYSWPRASQSERNCDQWLQERYREAASVKVGMTRAELKKVFSEDGGLQPIPANRYVLKSSNLIKVDVQFESPADTNYRNAPDDHVHIKSISKPYLEPAYTD